MKKLICKLFGHKWTGGDVENTVIMHYLTGHYEGCIRCGVLK